MILRDDAKPAPVAAELDPVFDLSAEIPMRPQLAWESSNQKIVIRLARMIIDPAAASLRDRLDHLLPGAKCKLAGDHKATVRENQWIRGGVTQWQADRARFRTRRFKLTSG